jgi:hypothetical protein
MDRILDYVNANNNKIEALSIIKDKKSITIGFNIGNSSKIFTYTTNIINVKTLKQLADIIVSKCPLIDTLTLPDNSYYNNAKQMKLVILSKIIKKYPSPNTETLKI